MKKIFTLLFALGAITTAFAQYDHRDARDVVDNRPYFNNDNRGFGNDDHRFGNDDRRFIFSVRERDDLIRQVNWRYDNQIDAVFHDRFLRGGERRRQVRFLEDQRREQIKQINWRYEQGCRFHDRF